MLRALTCLLAALLLAGCDSRTQPDARERELLLTAADFGEPEAPGQARLRRETNYLTRRVDISYDYRQTPGFFLHSGVSLMPNATDAVVSSFAAIQGAGIGISNADGDVTQETLALSRELGSHAELILLRSAGEPVGNMFAVSIGEKMFFTVFSGRHHFASATAFEDFIAPKLALLEAHDYDDPFVDWGKGLLAERAPEAEKPAKP